MAGDLKQPNEQHTQGLGLCFGFSILQNSMVGKVASLPLYKRGSETTRKDPSMLPGTQHPLKTFPHSLF